MEKYVSTVTAQFDIVTQEWVTENNGHIAAVSAAMEEVNNQNGFILFTNYGVSTEEVMMEDGTGYRTTTAIITFIPRPMYRLVSLTTNNDMMRMGFNDKPSIVEYLSTLTLDNFQYVRITNEDDTIWDYTGEDSLANL